MEFDGVSCNKFVDAFIKVLFKNLRSIQIHISSAESLICWSFRSIARLMGCWVQLKRHWNRCSALGGLWSTKIDCGQTPLAGDFWDRLFGFDERFFKYITFSRTIYCTKWAYSATSQAIVESINKKLNEVDKTTILWLLVKFSSVIDYVGVRSYQDVWAVI